MGMHIGVLLGEKLARVEHRALFALEEHTLSKHH
jgi:hypothetical protein